MKFITLLLILLLMTGCEKTGSPTSPELQSPSGTLSFSFDKANAPAAVKTLTATLSRSGFTPIVKIIDITADTAASILFQNIAVGTWKVTVDAKDVTGLVLYTGQSEVIVLENSVSQVNLTLMPVTTGVGSVQIHVTWGTRPSTNYWIDYGSNPILKKIGSIRDMNGIAQPKIFYSDSTYYMFYANLGTPASIGYAVSADGVKWFRPDSNIAIEIKNLNGWNLTGISTGAVYTASNTYCMMFQGYDGSVIQMGLAVSTDMINWEMWPQPVLRTNSDERYIVGCDVEEINGIYHLYYSVRKYNGETYIGIATSTDGFTWVRSSIPIVTQSQSWEAGGVMYPSVLKTESGYMMLYTNAAESFSANEFGIATSSDGKQWTKMTNNPTFRWKETSNQWASGGIVYPSLARVGNQIRMYYTGLNSSGESQIGFAIKK